MSEQEFVGVCDVCRVLDNDLSLKPVSYCSFCHAYICKNDLYSVRRIKAWAKVKGLSLQKLKEWAGLG